MLKIFTFLLAVFLTLPLFGEAKKLTVLCTTDPHTKLETRRDGKTGGWTRAASVIERERKAAAGGLCFAAGLRRHRARLLLGVRVQRRGGY